MIPSLSPAVNQFLNGVSRLQATITNATSQLTSGYKISQPSDAPDQISPLLQLQASLSHNQAVGNNLTRVQTDVSNADQAVSTALQLLDQALSIGAQGASSSVGAATRLTLAQQAQSVQEQMVALANFKVAGRYVFSGNQDNLQPYALDPNPPVQIGRVAAASLILPADTAVFNVQTTAGSTQITLTGQAGDTLQGQVNQLNTQLQGLGISASLDGSGKLQFQSSNAFSVSAQATGMANLVDSNAPESANNLGLNHYQFTGQTPVAVTGGNSVEITVGGTRVVATLINPTAPTAADITAINSALQAQGVTTVSAVLDQTAANTISFQGSSTFSVSDDHKVSGTYVLDGNSIPSNGVNRLITPTATRQIELSDHSFTTVDQTAQDLFDHRNADDAPAQDNVFLALNSLRAALTDTGNPDQAGEIITAQSSVQAASAYLNAKETFYGTSLNRLSGAVSQINTENTSLQEQISAIRDTDSVQMALELTSAETQTQAAMAAESKIPHSSLFDFLG